MSSAKTFGLMLVEFDSLKGPLVRKSRTKNNETLELEMKEDILMWILRANEFSYRKYKKGNIFAQTLELTDPNFHRKKRQFGLALIATESFDIKLIEKFLDNIIHKCTVKNNNQSYFRMLNGLIEMIKIIPLEIPEMENPSINIQTQLPVEQSEKSSEDIPFLLISNKLQIIHLVKMLFTKQQTEIIVGHPEAYEENNTKLKTLKFSKNDINIEICLNTKLSDDLEIILELFTKILNNLTNLESITNRILIVVEFLDRLMVENVDIQYYLPFIQYLLMMENYTFTEFNYEQFSHKITELQETHGNWINCLRNKKFEGEKLNKYFELTGIKREALELLIDLLFVKIVTIF